MDADPLTAETLTFEGTEPLKSLAVNAGDQKAGTVRVGAYAVRFADPSEKDLTGDYFTKSTDFGPRAGDGVATMFNHGIPIAKGAVFQEFARRTFPAVKATRDELGIFVETTLDLADQYQAAIADLCQKGALRWSSGNSEHMMLKSASGEIQRWHPVEFSFTPIAAEPRLPAIRPLKSLQTYEAAIAGPTPPLSQQLADALTASLSENIVAAPGAAADAATSVDTPETANPPVANPTITMPEKTPEELEAERKTSLKSTDALRLEEINEMVAIGNRCGCLKTAYDFIGEGKGPNDLRRHVVENLKGAKPIEKSPELGLDKKELRRWSIVKAIRDLSREGGQLEGIEKEASDATAARLGKQCKGFFIPHDIFVSQMAETHDLGTAAVKALINQANGLKALNSTTFTSGGALVGTELMTGSMIELLRNKTLLAQMGCMSLTGLQGNVAIPRMNGGATAYWLSETGTATESDQAFGQLGLTPKRLVGDTAFAKELINQTDLSVEALARNDLTTVIGIAKDLAGISGAGGAQPLGILNTTGVGSVTFGATATRAKAIAFQSTVAAANASRGSLAYLTTPTVAAAWMSVAEAPNYPKWLWDGNVDSGIVVGRRAETTNQVPGNRVIYGNFNDLILADWAGVDVVVDPYTLKKQGLVEITITIWTDIGVRHAVSFAISTDNGNQ